MRFGELELQLIYFKATQSTLIVFGYRDHGKKIVNLRHLKDGHLYYNLAILWHQNKGATAIIVAG